VARDFIQSGQISTFNHVQQVSDAGTCKGTYHFLVYHSPVREHFSKANGLSFLKCCFRILRRGGIIRVAVPDLERTARLYIEALDKSLNGDPVWRERYEWILLEIYDQTVRNYSGGEMLSYKQRDPMLEREFVASRMGSESKVVSLTKVRAKSGKTSLRRSSRANWYAWRYDVGCFRLSGEVHHWMYDAYSLGKALQEAGFSNPQRRQPEESAISNWKEFNLDTDPDGTIYKPDSLYIEATKGRPRELPPHYQIPSPVLRTHRRTRPRVV
jgi:hypothetical protein